MKTNNGIKVPYAGEFVRNTSDVNEFYDLRNNKWMYKATFLSAIKFALLLGSKKIHLHGFDFSWAHGRAVENDLIIDIPLRKFTHDEIMVLQKKSLLNIIKHAAQNNVEVVWP